MRVSRRIHTKETNLGLGYLCSGLKSNAMEEKRESLTQYLCLVEE